MGCKHEQRGSTWTGQSQDKHHFSHHWKPEETRRISETSLSLLNFSRLEAELLPPSSFPTGYKIMPAGNGLWNSNQKNLYFTVTLTQWKSTFAQLYLVGHGTNHCPRETLLYLHYSMRISRHSLLQTSALYSFCNTAAILNIRLTVKLSDSVLNPWVPFWTKSSSFPKD